MYMMDFDVWLSENFDIIGGDIPAFDQQGNPLPYKPFSATQTIALMRAAWEAALANNRVDQSDEDDYDDDYEDQLYIDEQGRQLRKEEVVLAMSDSLIKEFYRRDLQPILEMLNAIDVATLKRLEMVEKSLSKIVQRLDKLDGGENEVSSEKKTE